MTQGGFGFFRRRRFLPLFLAQFFGAANDNVLKNAMALLIIYRLGEGGGGAAQVLTTVATGLFMLPYFLFSSTAGELADRFAKDWLVKRVKLCELPIAALGASGLWLGNVTLMLAALFLLGAQATFFAPIKYAILPELLREEELLGGNGLIEGGTFLAILFGTIAGGLLILSDHGVLRVTLLLLALAAAGIVASLAIPHAHPGNRAVRVSANPFAGTLAILRTIAAPREVFLSVMGISWFWAVGATFVTEFPAYAKDVLGADENVVTLMLAMFSIGIGIGSALCSKLLKGKISARFVPFGALGMALFSFDLYFASAGLHPASAALIGIGGLIAAPHGWRILADLVLIAGFGGLFTVPLYAIVQSRVAEAERARAIAANNIVNAAFMVAASAVTAALLAAGLTVVGIFLILAILTTLAAIYICRLLPDAVLRGVLASLLRLAYGVEVKGAENLKLAGERVVVIANHVSYIDAALLAVFIPRRLVFAVNTFIARKWWVRPFLGLVEAFPLDPTNPLSVRSLTRKVESGGVCVIFPEGRLTLTGALMKIYEGPGVIADKAKAAVVPVRIEGTQYTPFSRLLGKTRRHWFPKITLTVLPPRHFEVPAALVGRRRRQRISAALYDIMSRMVFETGNRERSLYDAFLDARALHGGRAPRVEDITRTPASYDRLATASLALGRFLARETAEREFTGILLPNATATVASILALHAYGRIPAMLNYTSGVASLTAAARTAGIRLVITSRRFVEQARLGALVAGLGESMRILYLEDVQKSLTLGDKLLGALGRPWARALHRRRGVVPGDPALVLFTSGSEGSPKGVVLSHRNILANCLQLGARLDFNASDKVFNALPLFHSFGLTGGLFLPLLAGVRIFLYPSPLHYRIVPELVYDNSATIFFGTNTFLLGYARQANAYDFYSLRYIFAGAEKVEERTRQIYAEKFGLRILEGYGVTETSPVIACNTPMHFRAGTVGRLMPGIEHRLEPVPGIAEGGRLYLRGPNVMLGYLRAENPGVIEPAPEGWHDTGDIVTIDEDGFLRIAGRAKRFAKIGGEMVSLSAVETVVAKAWPEEHHAIAARADARKGEQLVLVTTRANLTRGELAAAFRTAGLSELMAPKEIVSVERIPLLGTGKTDYPAIARLLGG